MKQYAVITTDEYGHINTDKIKAKNPMHAFAVLAKKKHREFDAVMCMEWDVFHSGCESQQIEFPGSGLVDRSTILEQKDVFK